MLVNVLKDENAYIDLPTITYKIANYQSLRINFNRILILIGFENPITNPVFPVLLAELPVIPNFISLLLFSCLLT